MANPDNPGQNVYGGGGSIDSTSNQRQNQPKRIERQLTQKAASKWDKQGSACALNLMGLATKTSNKLDTPDIRDLFNNKNHIVLFVETWGHRHINFDVPHFQYFELNRALYKPSSKRASDGIIICIREAFIKSDPMVLLLKDNDDVIWMRLR